MAPSSHSYPNTGFCLLLGIQLMALHVLRKRSTTEPLLSPSNSDSSQSHEVLRVVRYIETYTEMYGGSRGEKWERHGSRMGWCLEADGGNGCTVVWVCMVIPVLL